MSPLLARRSMTAAELMRAFARRTTGRRYLWTDAFAVCNFIGLARTTGEPDHGELALQLVARVHHVLGKHRDDDQRTGWISGLDAATAEAHPTRGGLRIGKPLPERGEGEPYDELVEWERDGQYFHYLTRWMHALDQVARWRRDPMFNRWARELAIAAYRGFRCNGRLVWKASIDLSRPLVASMGQHDPLDGYVTCLGLEATARALGATDDGPAVAGVAAELAKMIDRDRLATSDPLGLGGLLVDAYRLATLPGEPGLVDDLLDAAFRGLRAYIDRSEVALPASRRLAFRELGLAIGLAAVERIDRAAARETLGRLERYARLRPEIEGFWLRPEHRHGRTYLDHADINDVMLATALVPDGFLATS